MADALAVVNASPLIILSRGRHLDLLRSVAAEMLVPGEVATEIHARGEADPTTQALRASRWLRVMPPKEVLPAVAAWGLGPGESAVLSEAARHAGTVAILDDLAGRRCAASLGVPVRGTLGIVLRAKSLGLVPSARRVMEDLLRGGLYLSRDVLDRALAQVGE